jgi:NAD-dependent SIR2 family protein deacetylase
MGSQVEPTDQQQRHGGAPARASGNRGLTAAAPSAAPAAPAAPTPAAAPPRVRSKLPGVNTLADVVALLSRCTRVLVLAGAGMSTAVGIPDFRSAGGLYDTLAASRHPALASVSEPQELFDIRVFREEPEVFYSVAGLLYKHLAAAPAPSRAHRFLAAMEAAGRLQRVYTQNVDGLEDAAGITRVVHCHGSLRTASCQACKRTVPCAAIAGAIAAGTVARCDGPKCAPRGPSARGVMKPDVIFFHEALPAAFFDALPADAATADLLLVIGSSLRVKPVSDLPAMLRPGTPAILINAEPIGTGAGAAPHAFDVELLGDADAITAHLWRAVGWGAAGAEGAAAGGAPEYTFEPPARYRFAPPPAMPAPGGGGSGVAGGGGGGKRQRGGEEGASAEGEAEGEGVGARVSVVTRSGRSVKM